MSRFPDEFTSNSPVELEIQNLRTDHMLPMESSSSNAQLAKSWAASEPPSLPCSQQTLLLAKPELVTIPQGGRGRVDLQLCPS